MVRASDQCSKGYELEQQNLPACPPMRGSMNLGQGRSMPNWFTGGGWGLIWLIFLRKTKARDFLGGGGGPDPLPPWIFPCCLYLSACMPVCRSVEYIFRCLTHDIFRITSFLLRPSFCETSYLYLTVKIVESDKQNLVNLKYTCSDIRFQLSIQVGELTRIVL